LVKQNEVIKDENAGLKDNGNKEHNDRARARVHKRPFVEPVISVPVDVLEATTFFQSATSGATN
jgi:hypothetical protein